MYTDCRLFEFEQRKPALLAFRDVQMKEDVWRNNHFGIAAGDYYETYSKYDSTPEIWRYQYLDDENR